MFPTKNLLVFLALALASSTLVSADLNDNARRNHAEVNRMIRKRAPQLDPFQIVGAGSDPKTAATQTQAQPTTGPGGVANAAADPKATDTTAAGTAAGTAGTVSVPGTSVTLGTTSSSTVTSATISTTSSTASVPASLSASGSSTESSVAASSSSNSVQSSSTASLPSSSSTSSTSSSTSSSVTTTPAASKTEVATKKQETTIMSKGKDGVVYQTVVQIDVTATVPAQSSETQLPPPPQAKLSHGGKVSLTVIGAIAGTVAGIAIIMAVIRKWKLRPSEDFDDRMKPIDWQPTDANDDSGLPSHRRSVASSFHSTGHEGSNFAGNGGGYGATSNYGHGQEHDFAAAPGLAPVGGYADLNRGPSPQPYDTSRGPSPPMQQTAQYDRSMPLHYQNGAYDLGNGNTGPRY